MPETASQQETRIYTRMEHPRRVRIMRYLWLGFAILTLAIYIIGFVDFLDVLRRGRPLIDQAILSNVDGEVVINQPSEALQAAGIQDGDVLLAINDETSMIEPLRDDLSESDSSIMMNFPTEAGLSVNDSLRLTLRHAEENERSINLIMKTPNNLVTRSLLRSGFSLDAAEAFTFIIELIYAIGFIAMAMLIFWSRSDDWMALLVASAILLLGLSTGVASHLDSIVFHDPRFRLFVWVGGVVTYAAAYLFPDARIAPRWSLVFPIIYVIQLVASFFKLSSGWTALAYVVSLIGVLWTQYYRYHNLYTRPQRQQAKWMLIGLLSLILSLIIVASYRQLFRTGLGDVASLYFAISFPLETTLSMALPVGVAFAILHYRLWDIDIVINRSVVYAGVIVVLTLVFTAAFIASQVILTQILNIQAAGFAVGISALVVGVTFNPVRQRIQHFIDRNVYHLRFDLNQLQAAQQQVTNPGALSGRIIGRYQLLDLIGRGGMGEVYKAVYNNKTFAIKTLRLDTLVDHQAQERFLRESSIQLDHPNIAAVIEVGEHESSPYMVMEFIEGLDVKEHLDQHGPFDAETVIEIAQGICAGLQVAHDKGYIHRDIKPANIMLRPNPDNETFTPVITDFGIAKLKYNEATLTGTGAIGTIDYMSPEQIQMAREVDHRADIYALGVVIYEMLTGEKPFPGSPAQILFGHLKQPPPDPLHIKPATPMHLAIAIMQAMSKDPEARFRTAAQFAAMLEP
jgi:tRNA A-37 threonylcarbamoyl transferase component Bud32